MPFQRQDLIGTHYQQHDDNKQLFSGQPSRRVFDRFNSSQVLFIINSYASWFEKFTPDDVKAVENQIATRLPLGTSSEISVFNWLRSSATKPMPAIF
jgi:hypothetical protein